MPEFNKHSSGPSDAPQQPHRCNGHLEDVLEGLSSWPMDVSKPFGVFLQCLKSQPGQEPLRYSQQQQQQQQRRQESPTDSRLIDSNATTTTSSQ